MFHGFNKQLGNKFLGFRPEYKNALLEEEYVMMRHLNCSWTDILKMPVYQRKFFLRKFQEEIEKMKEEQENQGNRGTGEPPVSQEMEDLGKTKFDSEKYDT